jgi:hypothetical protein
MNYEKAVAVQDLKENASAVLQSVKTLTAVDAMNALGVAVSHIVVENWSPQDRMDLVSRWFAELVKTSVEKFK